MERTARFMFPDRLTEAKLISTATARHFYRRRGYKEAGPPYAGAGVSWNHPLVKTL
jgi:histone acetyltransferase (RNA polymerase elongator complex component)